MSSPESLPETSVRWYPETLERWWVGHAKRRYGGTPGQALSRLAPAAGALSDLFTVDRPAAFEAYAEDDEARLAYGVFFGPQTWVRTRLPLVEAIDLRGWRPPTGRPVRIVDLGAGVGTAGFGAAHLLAARGLASTVKVTSVDRSRASLADLRSGAGAAPDAARNVTFETVVDDVREWTRLEGVRAKTHDLVIASFALNEAFSSAPDEEALQWLADAAALLAEDGLLLVIEPAQRPTAERLRRLAAAALATGTVSLWGPDLGTALAPPEPSGRFWDHEVRRWTAPKSVVAVNAVLRRSLRELTFSYVLLGRRPPTAPEATANVLRLTSPIGRTRGRREWTAVDGTGARTSYDLLERHLTDEEDAFLARVERGDVLRVRAPTPHRVPGRFRVGAAADLEILHHPR